MGLIVFKVWRKIVGVVCFVVVGALAIYGVLYYQTYQICQRVYTPAKISYEQDVTIIPLINENDRYFVMVTINGKGPFKLLLDSGSPYTVIRKDVVKKAGLQNKEVTKRFAAASANLKLYRADTIHIGKTELSDMVVINDQLYDAAQKHNPSRVDGVLSLSAFQDKLISIDLSRGILKLSNGQLSKNDKLSMELKEAYQKMPVSLPFMADQKAKTIHPQVTLTYLENNQPISMNFYIDTGAQRIDTVIFQGADLEKIHYDIDNKMGATVARLEFFNMEAFLQSVELKGTIQFGNMEISKPKVLARTKPYSPIGTDYTKKRKNISQDNEDIHSNEVPNLMGTAALKNKIMIIDAKNNLIQLVPYFKTKARTERKVS